MNLGQACRRKTECNWQLACKGKYRGEIPRPWRRTNCPHFNYLARQYDGVGGWGKLQLIIGGAGAKINNLVRGEK